MGRVAITLVLLASLAHGQTLPYSFSATPDGKVDPTALQEDFEFLISQTRKNSAQIANTTIVGIVSSVTASAPLASSGGTTPNITLSNTFSSSMTFTASGGILVNSSVTANAFFGDGSHLTGVSGESNTYTSSKTFTSDVLAKSSVTANAFFGDASHLSGMPCSVAGTQGVACNGGANSNTLTGTVAFGGNGSSNNIDGYGSGNVAGASNHTSGQYSASAGGNSNTTGGLDSFAGGGFGNSCSGNNSSCIGGTGMITAGQRSVGIGGSNLRTPGDDSVAWGISNSASGNATTAAGILTTANGPASFVWSDGGTGAYSDHTAATFNVHTASGTYFDGAGVIAASSVTASAFFGDASHLSNIIAANVAAANVLAGTLLATVVASSFTFNPTFLGTETVKGNAFSVGASSFVVTAGSVTVGYGLSVGTNTTATAPGITVYGVVTSSTPTATSISCTAGSGTIIDPSDNQSGSFTAGALATACTVNFSIAWPKTPKCFCSVTNTPVAIAPTSTTTSVTCTSVAALTGDTLNYFCWSKP